MDPKAKHLLDVFINNAHKNMPQPSDMCRFFDFMIAVHGGRLAASAEEVLDLTLDASFPNHIAVRLAMVFGHGVELLKRYEEARGGARQVI